jgi:SAM-dependent methyltransferase
MEPDLSRDESSYLLPTGLSGAYRLRVQDRAYAPSTRRILADAGLKAGSHVAEIGCGIGVVTSWIAARVTPGGSVVAVDASESQLEIARLEASSAGVTNVTFLVTDAAHTGLPRASFDLVCSRFLLAHLPHRIEALQEMLALLKPGGAIVCEEGDPTTTFSYPPCAAYQWMVDRARPFAEMAGYDFALGLKLPAQLQELGFESVEVSFTQPVFLRGDEKRLPQLLLWELAPTLTSSGLATADEIRDVCAEMEEVSSNVTAIVALERATQVWARKL